MHTTRRLFSSRAYGRHGSKADILTPSLVKPVQKTAQILLCMRMWRSCDKSPKRMRECPSLRDVGRFLCDRRSRRRSSRDTGEHLIHVSRDTIDSIFGSLQPLLLQATKANEERYIFVPQGYGHKPCTKRPIDEFFMNFFVLTHKKSTRCGPILRDLKKLLKNC